MTDQEVYLGLGVVARVNLPYKERAKRLVEEARRHKDRDKEFISSRGLESLIGAGAEIKSLNVEQEGVKSYYSNVIFKGINFVTASKKPVIFHICEALK